MKLAAGRRSDASPLVRTQGRVIASLAREGGLQSPLWAGPESISRAMKRGEQPVCVGAWDLELGI